MSSQRGKLAAVALALVVTALIVGLVTGVVPRAARGALYGTGLWRDGGSASLDPALAGRPAPEMMQPPPVLDIPPPGPAVSASAVAKRIRAVEDKGVGGRVSAFVAQADGTQVYSAAGTRANIPASTMKILTSASALALLGAEHRFETTVTRSEADQIVLVGGGDPYLCHRQGCAPQSARLQTLADQTARELQLAKTPSVSLGYDDSLFSGPAWNPAWPAGYSDQVTATSALWVDEGRVDGTPGPRVSDPAKEAAKSFAGLLKKSGIEVTGVSQLKSPEAAEEIAAVQSQPLSVIVEEILLRSDNDGAEVLLRQVGVSGAGRGSIKAGQKVLAKTISELATESDGLKIVDGSGLARSNRVPAKLLVELVELGLDSESPELRALATGLPVAGVSGSLTYRFVSPATDAARGMVRAKTGTLRKTHSLAGYVQTEDGATLAFAFLVNDAESDYAARVWLDRVSAAIAECGCAER